MIENLLQMGGRISGYGLVCQEHSLTKPDHYIVNVYPPRVLVGGNRKSEGYNATQVDCRKKKTPVYDFQMKEDSERS